jgi:SAM-dependent methyltransferase
MFKKIYKKFSSIINRDSNSLDYWRSRVRKFGQRSVINVDHSVDDFERVKKRDQEELFPVLSKLLNGRERLILDFGCGSGRFTADLAEQIKGKAIGIDPTKELIQLAIPSKIVTFQVMKEGEIPLGDQSVDAIWIYAVLGGINGNALNKSVANIQRVLKDNGLLFITENTTEAPNSKFWTYRDVSSIQALFKHVHLKHLHDYFDSGRGFNERFSVLAGRKQ